MNLSVNGRKRNEWKIDWRCIVSIADCWLTGKYEVVCVDTMTVCRYGGCWHWCGWCWCSQYWHIAPTLPLPGPTLAHPGLGVTTVSELRIQCIVVWDRAKYTASTHWDNGSDCNTSLMMSYPWHHLLALSTSHSLNESLTSQAEQCVDCLCHCNNSRLGWARSLNRWTDTSSPCICVQHVFVNQNKVL